MSNYSKIYWFTRLDSFHSLLTILVVCGIVFSFFVVLFSLISKDFDEFHNEREVLTRQSLRRKFQNKLKLVLPLCLVFLIMNTFLPTKNEALLIMAGGKTLDFVQGDSSLSKIPSQTTSIISSFLEKQLKEMKSTDK